MARQIKKKVESDGKHTYTGKVEKQRCKDGIAYVWSYLDWFQYVFRDNLCPSQFSVFCNLCIVQYVLL